MSSPEGLREFFIIDALVKVKSKRMGTDVAIKDAIEQRHKKEKLQHLHDIEDMYVAGNLLMKEHEWFRKEVSEMTVAMQKGN